MVRNQLVLHAEVGLGELLLALHYEKVHLQEVRFLLAHEVQLEEQEQVVQALQVGFAPDVRNFVRRDLHPLLQRHHR